MSQLPGWSDDDHLEAFDAFAVSARRAMVKPYKPRGLTKAPDALKRIWSQALSASIQTQTDARNFFEHHFVAQRLHHDGMENTFSGHLTGYYEPVVQASTQRDGRYAFPLLSRPGDLIDITDTNRPDDMPAHIRYGRRCADGRICMYHPRSAIEGDQNHQGVLAGQSLEIAWVADPMDAYFIHIQGSARLDIIQGGQKRITYVAKSGHDYTSIGKHMVVQGHLKADNVTMESLRTWFADNPQRRTEITWVNDSYIFFEEVAIDDPFLGPVAAAKTSLIPGRSLAVDRELHSFGAPLWITTDRNLPGQSLPLARLMIAQDTGSAIVGAARGDFFVGSGHQAGEAAGAINHSAGFWLLQPKADG